MHEEEVPVPYASGRLLLRHPQRFRGSERCSQERGCRTQRQAAVDWGRLLPGPAACARIARTVLEQGSSKDAPSQYVVSQLRVRVTPFHRSVLILLSSRKPSIALFQFFYHSLLSLF